MSEEEINKIIYTLEMHHIDSKPVSDLLEAYKQLEKENKPLEYNNATLEKQVKLMRDNFTIAVEQEVKENYIPKSVIREKLDKEKFYMPEYMCEMIPVEYIYLLLGGSNEE